MADSDFNHIQDAIAALHEGLAKAVEQAAQEVRDTAKAQAPVRTGYLRDSLYAVTREGSDYASGNGAGEAKDGKSLSLPEVPKPASDLEAVMAVGATYGEFVELGTRKMAAEPYVLPAVDAVRKRLSADAAAHITLTLTSRLGK